MLTPHRTWVSLLLVANRRYMRQDNIPVLSGPLDLMILEPWRQISEF
jgi:hypothetical protein